jgi:hypothetical protein
MYIIHLDLDNLLAQLRPGVQVWVQDFSILRREHGIAVRQEQIIIIAFIGGKDTVHAARIRVEIVSLLGDAHTASVAASQRRQEALSLVQAAIRRIRAHPGMGLLLVPGLREDLEHYETSHRLWSWENIRDDLHRRLVPEEPND